VSPSSWRSAAPAILAAAWGGNHFSPLLLLYRQVDGYSAVQVNLFFASYVLGLVPGFLCTGPLSDRYGRKPPVAVALVLGILGSVILAAGSASPLWMCVGRLISGVSVAVAMVAGTAWIKELSQHDANPAVWARRASLTLTAGFGVGAGVSGALAQWGPAPTVLPYAVHVALSVAAAIPLAHAPETATAGTGRSPFTRVALSIPAAGRRRFAGLILPLAPWVFGAPALAFVVGPALVTGRTAGFGIGFATLAAVLTLAVGAGVQPYVPRLARLTRGYHGAAGLLILASGTALLAVDAIVRSPVLAAGAAVVLGAAYGVCIVAGLVEVQAMATPDTLAGLTGIYWSLTYVGFALPVVLAGLAGHAPYEVLLGVVAVIALGCAAIVSRTVRRGERPQRQ
jgi:MFS family permease